VILVREVDEIEKIVKDSYHYAKSGKPGPVVIDLPMDVQVNSGKYKNINPEIFKNRYDEERHLSIGQCKIFFDFIGFIPKTVIVYWWWLNNPVASEQVREFNRKFNIPSINSLMGKGILLEMLSLNP